MRDRSRPRTALDWIGIAATASVLAFLAATGFYGLMSGVTATLAYEATNLWIGLGCAALAMLCALYLAVEITSPGNFKLGVFFLVVCGFAGYYASIVGIPTITAQWAGQRGSVVFTVTEASMPTGARSCSYAIEATNADFVTLRLCAQTMTPRPRAGDRVQVDGYRSDWGITLDAVAVVP